MSVESAVSGIGSIAGAFGGGGSSGGGAVVGGPSPQAAIGAGLLQSQAAYAASQAATKAVNEAILAVNQNYQQARYDVQPYRTAGVQALNQLNQYLGLDADDENIENFRAAHEALEFFQSKEQFNKYEEF